MLTGGCMCIYASVYACVCVARNYMTLQWRMEIAAPKKDKTDRSNCKPFLYCLFLFLQILNHNHICTYTYKCMRVLHVQTQFCYLMHVTLVFVIVVLLTLGQLCKLLILLRLKCTNTYAAIFVYTCMCVYVPMHN